MGKTRGRGTITEASKEDIDLILAMRQQLASTQIPRLQLQANPHEYLYFAFLDGTGQNKDNPKLGRATTIGHLYDQTVRYKEGDGSRIGSGYAAGIGSHTDPVVRTVDGALALSWRAGIEKGYRQLVIQAEKWIKADPQAQIRVVGIGYSRGAVQTAGLLRLIDRYGIADPLDLSFGKDEHGNISVQSPYPPRIAPGQVIQAAMLLDPVATGMPANYDARLPPSVISRVAVMAAHERRTLFPHQAIIAETTEISPDRLAARLIAPGGHSNVGGGNAQNGLEILTGNLVVDYLNQLRDAPLFEHRPFPAALEDYARYQAGGATAGFGLALDADQQRDLRDELSNCVIVEPCHASEPIDLALAAQVPIRPFLRNRQEERALQYLGGRLHRVAGPDDTVPPSDPLEAFLQASENNDLEGMARASAAFQRSEPGQQVLAQMHEEALQEHRSLPGRDAPLFDHEPQQHPQEQEQQRQHAPRMRH